MMGLLYAAKIPFLRFYRENHKNATEVIREKKPIKIQEIWGKLLKIIYAVEWLKTQGKPNAFS